MDTLKGGRLKLPFKNLKVGIALYEDVDIHRSEDWKMDDQPNRISFRYLFRRVDIALCELYIRILFGKALIY
jgi:hypothetical protein